MDEAGALRLQLQQEQAARQEFELQSAATTRQLWLLRDKHDREVRQLQDQLSVVRASLILAHKQQQLLQTAQANKQNITSTADAAVSPASDDLLGSPRRGRRTPDQCSRLASRAPSRASTPASKTCSEQSEQQAASELATAAETAADDVLTTSTAAEDAGLEVRASPDSNNHVVTATATQLLAAAAKLQQLVEQLTHKEPAIAADLSLLQWQLTAAYGTLTQHSRSNSRVSQGLSAENSSQSLGSEPSQALATISGADSGGGSGSDSSPGNADAIQQQAPEGDLRIGVGSAPIRDATLVRTNSDPLLAAAAESSNAATAVGPQQSAVDVAAAAQLFSGAASTSQSAQIDWYYIDVGSIRGPHDPALMIRWYCSCFLEGSLPVAGVVLQADGSSSPPPESAFEPLRLLLDRVQQQGTYTPYGELQEAPSSPLPAHKHMAAAAAGPRLPVSRHSRAPSGNPSKVAGSPKCQVNSSAVTAAGTGQVVTSWDALMGQYAGGQVEEQLHRQQESPVAVGSRQLQYPCTHQMQQQYTYEAAVTARQGPLQQQQQQQNKGSKLQQEHSMGSAGGWSIAAVSAAAYAAYDVIEGVSNAVESAVTATVESIINTAESALAGQLSEISASSSAKGLGSRKGSSTAFEFISDLPQLFPAAVMQGMQQQQQQQQLGPVLHQSHDHVERAVIGSSSTDDAQEVTVLKPLAIPVVAGQHEAATSGPKPPGKGAATAPAPAKSQDGNEGEGGDGGYMSRLPGVWRVEGLHSMLQSLQH